MTGVDHPPPKFGLLTDPLEPVLPQIARFNKLGFDYVEVGIEEPKATPQILLAERAEILHSLSAHGMSTVGHTAYWVEFGSAHERARRGWIDEAKEMIQVASELQINLLNFHFYVGHGRVGASEESKDIFLENFIDAMKELTQHAAGLKVDLMLENHPPVKRNLLESIDSFSQVMNSVPALRFHLDVAHAFIENGMRGVKRYIDSFENRLAHVHMHDNHGELDEHLPLGKGSINVRRVIELLKRIGYDKTVTFEVFTSESDAVRSRRIFEKQWRKA
jgi:sugar phosphate isomerase/epimerase